MTQQILYIPGFGDHDKFQLKALKKWQRTGVETHFIKINWADDETYGAKLDRVLAEVDRLRTSYGKISLVGVSAGASLAMNAYSASKDSFSGVVFICGKLTNAEGVNESYFRKNPAFKESIFTSQENVKKLTTADRSKILTLRSVFDGLIPAADSQIPGAINRVLPFILHIPTIFIALTLCKKRTLSFLKAQSE